VVKRQTVETFRFAVGNSDTLDMAIKSRKFPRVFFVDPIPGEIAHPPTGNTGKVSRFEDYGGYIRQHDGD